jgi:hypothetical protein
MFHNRRNLFGSEYAKVGVLLFLLFSLINPLYNDPPLESVYNTNIGKINEFDNFFVQNLSQRGYLTLFSYTMPLDASSALVTIDPSIDNIVHSSNRSHLIVAWGAAQLQHLPAVNHSGYCTAAECCIGEECQVGEHCSYFCDHDDDYCVEYENKSYVTKSAFVVFCFRGQCSNLTTVTNLIQIPNEIEELMRSTSGMENLTVKINTTIAFTYQINNRYYHGRDCYSNWTVYTSQMHFYEERNFTVAGSNILFFLQAPVLREQWYRNNHFDSVVLSTAKVRSAFIYFNGNLSSNFTFYVFNKTTDDFGAEHILSLSLLNATPVLEAGINSTPRLLQWNNQSFGYGYIINYTYQGIGKNNLTMSVITWFNDTFSLNESITSRALSVSLDNTESEIPFSPETVRKSEYFVQDMLTYATVAIGIISLLLGLVLVGKII